MLVRLGKYAEQLHESNAFEKKFLIMVHQTSAVTNKGYSKTTTTAAPVAKAPVVKVKAKAIPLPPAPIVVKKPIEPIEPIKPIKLIKPIEPIKPIKPIKPIPDSPQSITKVLSHAWEGRRAHNAASLRLTVEYKSKTTAEVLFPTLLGRDGIDNPIVCAYIKGLATTDKAASRIHQQHC